MDGQLATCLPPATLYASAVVAKEASMSAGAAKLRWLLVAATLGPKLGPSVTEGASVWAHFRGTHRSATARHPTAKTTTCCTPRTRAYPAPHEHTLLRRVECPLSPYVVIALSQSGLPIVCGLLEPGCLRKHYVQRRHRRAPAAAPGCATLGQSWAERALAAAGYR